MRRVMTRRGDARLVFRIELGSILRVFNARQRRALKTRVKNAGVTSHLGLLESACVLPISAN